MLFSVDEDDLFSFDKESEHDVLNLFLEVVGQSRSGVLVACEDSSELSSFDGSPVPGDARCLVV